MSRHREIEDRAIEWLIRKDEPGWSDAEQRELDRWLDVSMAHKAAYWRAEEGWRAADRIRSLGAKAEEATVPPAWTRPWWPTSLAAGVALAIGIGAYSLAPGERTPVEIAQSRFVTKVGGQRAIPLSDGSRVELNTASTLRTAIGERSRDVWLDKGEAYFEVAHRDGLPFVVHAGRQTVTVLGTKFSVRRDEDRVTVNVLEGRVRVDDGQNGSGRAAIISAGDFAVARGPSTLIASKSPEHVENALAWRDGMLSFDRASLSDVAAEFNRYNDKTIEIDDTETARIRIGGSFQASNVAAFVRLLRDAYGLKVEENAERIKISS